MRVRYKIQRGVVARQMEVKIVLQDCAHFVAGDAGVNKERVIEASNLSRPCVVYAWVRERCVRGDTLTQAGSKVILACGGISWDDQRRDRQLPVTRVSLNCRQE